MGCLAIARLSVLETLRRKEFYIVLVLVLALGVWIQSMSVEASRFAKDIVMQVIWLASFGLAVPLAARQITSDVEQKTIYVLISRPIHRWQYVFGRTGGAVAAALVCFTGFFLVLIAMLSLKGVSAVIDASLWQAYALQVAALVMLCSIAVVFSTVSTTAGAVTFSLIILVVMRYGGQSILHKIEDMTGIARDMAWAGYIALPHFEFFNIGQRVVHGWGALPTSLFLQVIVYGLAYSIFATSLAAYLFKRRWL